MGEPGTQGLWARGNLEGVGLPVENLIDLEF